MALACRVEEPSTASITDTKRLGRHVVLMLERVDLKRRQAANRTAPRVRYRVTFRVSQPGAQNCIGVALGEGWPRLTMKETPLQPPGFPLKGFKLQK